MVGAKYERATTARPAWRKYGASCSRNDGGEIGAKRRRVAPRLRAGNDAVVQRGLPQCARNRRRPAICSSRSLPIVAHDVVARRGGDCPAAPRTIHGRSCRRTAARSAAARSTPCRPPARVSLHDSNKCASGTCHVQRADVSSTYCDRCSENGTSPSDIGNCISAGASYTGLPPRMTSAFTSFGLHRSRSTRRIDSTPISGRAAIGARYSIVLPDVAERRVQPMRDGMDDRRLAAAGKHQASAARASQDPRPPRRATAAGHRRRRVSLRRQLAAQMPAPRRWRIATTPCGPSGSRWSAAAPVIVELVSTTYSRVSAALIGTQVLRANAAGELQPHRPVGEAIGIQRKNDFRRVDDNSTDTSSPNASRAPASALSSLNRLVLMPACVGILRQAIAAIWSANVGDTTGSVRIRSPSPPDGASCSSCPRSSV